MHLPPPDLNTVRAAIRGLSTEAAEKRAVQRLLEERALGHIWPETVHGKVADGAVQRTVRVHLWNTAGFGGPVIALVTGPSVQGDARLLYPHSPGQPVGQVYIPASTRRPALTDAAPAGARRNPDEGMPADAASLLHDLVVRDGGSTSNYRSSTVTWLRERGYIAPVRAGHWIATDKGVSALLRRNPEGGREGAGTGSSLAQLQKAVSALGSEQAQVNLVARVLAGQGYARAGHPEVNTTTIDRSTFRVYLWRDTPFGDHLLLATGPSFEPKVALASQVPADPGVGIYVKMLVDKGSPASKRILGGAGRAADRALPKPTPAAEVAAERVARKARVPKATVIAAATQAAEAEGAPTVTVQHVEEAAPVVAFTPPVERSGEEVAAQYHSLSLLNAAAKKGKVSNAEHAAGITVLQQRAVDVRHEERTSAVNEAAAMREAAELIAALRKMRGAS